MFKILVLQSLYKFSGDQTELQIKGRLSFMRFLGCYFEDRVPDAKTLWLFRDTLSNKNVIDKLFRRFNRYLDREGLFARQWQLIDASIVPVPDSLTVQDPTQLALAQRASVLLPEMRRNRCLRR